MHFFVCEANPFHTNYGKSILSTKNGVRASSDPVEDKRMVQAVWQPSPFPRHLKPQINANLQCWLSDTKNKLDNIQILPKETSNIAVYDPSPPEPPYIFWVVVSGYYTIPNHRLQVKFSKICKNAEIFPTFRTAPPLSGESSLDFSARVCYIKCTNAMIGKSNPNPVGQRVAVTG